MTPYFHPNFVWTVQHLITWPAIVGRGRGILPCLLAPPSGTCITIFCFLRPRALMNHSWRLLLLALTRTPLRFTPQHPAILATCCAAFSPSNIFYAPEGRHLLFLSCNGKIPVSLLLSISSSKDTAVSGTQGHSCLKTASLKTTYTAWLSEWLCLDWAGEGKSGLLMLSWREGKTVRAACWRAL